jgi:large subunit ribosomal protein L23
MILKAPIITEKSMILANAGCYTFEVELAATKGQIAAEVATQFKVQVTGVKTMRIKGRTKRVGKKRVEVQLSPWKKAIVKLKKDQKIALFETAGGQK